MKNQHIGGSNRKDPAVQLYIREDPEIKRYVFWGDVLEPIIISLADQQIVTGYAPLLTAYARLPFPLSHRGRLPAQFGLVVYLSCVSGTTHLACMVVVALYLEKHPTLASIRLTLMILFGVFLIVSMGFHNASSQVRLMGILAAILLCLGFLASYLLALIHVVPSLKRWGLRLKPHYFPWVVIFASGNLGLSFMLACIQKFGPCDGKDVCPGLNTVAENAWGFGQVLPMVMLCCRYFRGSKFI